MNETELCFIKNLRQASPYIATHRNKTVVFYLPSKIISNHKNILQCAKDIVLLNNLGIKTVIVLGVTEQINSALTSKNIPWQYYQNIRITTQQHIKTIQETIGLVRSRLEAVFSQACAEQRLPLSLISGNWVIAKPKGVINGVDFKYTGTLRSINVDDINNTLNTGQICLLTPLSYSFSGEVFNLNSLEQAYAVAKKLASHKLIIFSAEEHLKKLPKSLNIADVKDQLLQKNSIILHKILQNALDISKHVKRIHLINQDQPSSILLELFTREGVGTLIYTDRYHQLRSAKTSDIAGILKLIKPLEKQGVLVKRTEYELNETIKNFIVAEIDNQIIGCAAIYTPTKELAEIACLVVDPNYQKDDIGKQLLNKAIEKAKKTQHNKIFTLTTHADHWFKEQGFKNSDITSLPLSKQNQYNKDRNSQILIRAI